jgi:hypothetical protein
MNRMWNLIFGIVLTSGVVVIVPAQAATIYVDKDISCPGGGTSTNPYCSIQNAFNVVNAGDTIRIRDSATPYDQNAVTTRSGTAGSPITLEPDTGHNPTIRYTGNGAQNGAIEIRNADYWTVRNLTFDGAGVYTSAFALWFQAATRDVVGIQVIGNTFKNWGGSESQAGTAGTRGALTISHGGGSPWFPTALIQGNTFLNNRLINIFLIHNKNTIVENNDISGTTCGRDSDTAINALGLKMIEVGATGIIVRNNTIHDFQAYSACTLPNAGFDTWAGLWCDVGPSNGEISGNLIYNIDQNKAVLDRQGSNGIFIEAGCYNWVIKNNVVQNIGVAGLRNGTVTPCDNNQWLNNTVYSVGLWGFVASYGKNITIKNNIFDDNGQAQIRIEGNAVAQGPHVIDYNLYYDTTGGTKAGQWGSITVLNFANWRNACGGCDSHSLNTDPKFVNAAGADFSLQATSPAQGTGEGGVDMGAYIDRTGEVLSAPQNLRVVP